MAADLLPADYVDQIPFSTFQRLLSRGPLLEAYPAKPSKLDLRPRGVAATSAEEGKKQAASAIADLTSRRPAPR